MPDDDRAEWLEQDAADARHALAMATQLAASIGHKDEPWLNANKLKAISDDWILYADAAYRQLRSRESLRVITSVQIIPGTPYEGTSPMATVFDINDTQTLPFALGGKDAKGAPVDLPVGYTAAWTFADPDASGAVFTPSADNTTATLTAGTPDVNLLVSVTVTVTNPDGTTTAYEGAEAVIVTAGPLQTIAIEPGVPTP